MWLEDKTPTKERDKDAEKKNTYRRQGRNRNGPKEGRIKVEMQLNLYREMEQSFPLIFNIKTSNYLFDFFLVDLITHKDAVLEIVLQKFDS